MYDEDELLPLSALQHLLFCERQCALIHIEQVWSENRLTVEGRHRHERVHEGGTESRGDVRAEYGVPIQSLELGLAGVADVVEFRRGEGVAQPFPVEHKRGKPKEDHSDEVQLCAQAMCLEEMLRISVPEGAIFYGRNRRRREVQFTETLRELTRQTARRLHRLVQSGRTPIAVREAKCRNCSLQDLCMPQLVDRAASVADYLANALLADDPE